MKSGHANSKLFGLVALVGLGILGNTTGCGAPAPDGSATADANSEDVQVVGEAIGHFHNGHIEFEDVASSSEPGLTTQNFGSQFTQTKIAFGTPSDGVGIGTCSSTQYCANTTVTNNTGVQMNNVFVEVTEIFGVVPLSGGPVALQNPVTVSATYKSAFKNSASPQAATYGTIAVGATSPAVEWKWDYGSATDFSFHVKVLASFKRPTVSGSLYYGGAASQPVDACAMAGHTTHFVGGDDAEVSLALPFAYNYFDVTYDNAVVSSNGYVLFYASGGSVPSRDQNNVSMVTAGLPVGMYAFWDDLAYDAPDGVCVATTGVAPNRFWNVTWKNAKINSVPGQASKGTWTSQKMTFSLKLQETYDTMVMSWGLPTGGIVDQTRGSTAHVGFNQTVGTKFQNNVVKNAVYFPPTSTSYPVSLHYAFFPVNP